MVDPSRMLASVANDPVTSPLRLGALTAVLATQHFASHAYLSSCEAPLEPFRHATVSSHRSCIACWDVAAVLQTNKSAQYWRLPWPCDHVPTAIHLIPITP